MAQFDVYPHPIEAMRKAYPYVLEIQSGFLKQPVAVIVVPLARLKASTSPVAILNPELQVAGETLVLETLAIASFEPGELRRPLARLRSQAEAVWSALDFAFHGY